MNTDLDAIQARADAATEGPWKAYDRGIGYEIHHAEDWAINDRFRETFTKADATFIAHARTDVPALLALVRSQQAQIERVRELHEPKSWTKYGIPCFDEFDSPTARINGCTCGHENYPCPTIAALTATEATA